MYKEECMDSTKIISSIVYMRNTKFEIYLSALA